MKHHRIEPIHYGGPEGFLWDHGKIAFGNPLDIPEAVREKRRKAKEVWKAKQRIPADQRRKRDYKYRKG
jgi:hypothetical protein